jgi:uncharacterized membrane protein YheB (UPF0754 family)
MNKLMKCVEKVRVSQAHVLTDYLPTTLSVGVVPTKTKVMAERLVTIITERLLSLQEAFGRLQPNELSVLLLPAVSDTIRNDCGEVWFQLLKPVLPLLLTELLKRLQNDIDDVLDLKSVVLSAFLRDKVVLVDLFQKVGRVELDFLVNSGFGFGFLLGLLQMGAWAAKPRGWTLPVAGALVGYVTNWIAIKLLFEPADPVDVLGLFQVQGMFESRQVEVSDEFGTFLEKRVLNASSLLKELASGGDDGELHAFLRKQLPYPIPNHILTAAVKAIDMVANNPTDYPEVHRYVEDKLDIQHTLSSRLKLLSSTDFEDLLHPVFQEDEITLIATGGVLGAIAGLGQTQLGWGGLNATRNAIVTIISVLSASAGFYLYQLYESQSADEKEDSSPKLEASLPTLRRRQTVVRIAPLKEAVLWSPEPSK